MTITHIAERLAVELSVYVLTTYVCRGRDSDIRTSTCGAHALTDCAIPTADNYLKHMTNLYPSVCTGIKNEIHVN